MSDIRRQLNTARNRIAEQDRTIKAFTAIYGDIDPGYAQAFADLCDLAIHGLRRPDDLGGPITTGHAESQPPRYHPAAYHHRNEERRIQRDRATRLRSIVEALTDDNQLTLKELAR